MSWKIIKEYSGFNVSESQKGGVIKDCKDEQEALDYIKGLYEEPTYTDMPSYDLQTKEITIKPMISNTFRWAISGREATRSCCGWRETLKIVEVK